MKERKRANEEPLPQRWLELANKIDDGVLHGNLEGGSGSHFVILRRMYIAAGVGGSAACIALTGSSISRSTASTYPAEFLIPLLSFVAAVLLGTLSIYCAFRMPSERERAEAKRIQTMMSPSSYLESRHFLIVIRLDIARRYLVPISGAANLVGIVSGLAVIISRAAW